MNYPAEYLDRINKGLEKVGRWVKLFYVIVAERLKSGEYHYNEQKANKAIAFIEQFCRHNKGKLAPTFIKLSLWEKAFIATLYGIVDESDKRIFREVALFVGRKCGKTLICSAILTYEAYVDGEYGSEIYCVAPKLDQSDLVFSAFEFNYAHSPDLAKRTRKRKNDVYIQQNNTTVKKIAFNEKKADGYSPMLTIADEVSSWPAEKGLKQWEVMVSGTGARQEPITLAISSGGYVDAGIYDELFKRGTHFLLGSSSEKHLLPLFYTIDDIDKWDDIEELHKSLPGLGESVSEQFILDEIEVARNSASKKREFFCKYCNQKQNSSLAWLETKTVQKMCGPALCLDDFAHSYCVGGLDLSQTTDLTCGLVVIEKNRELYVFSKFWMPAGKLDEAIARDGIPYDIYIKRGFLELSGDNFVDYHSCYNWFNSLVEQYEILPLMIGYDRYSAQYLVQDMIQYGYRMDDVFQGENLWPVIQEAEGLFKDGIVHIGDNELLKIHLLNSAIKVSMERNRGKLVKISPKEHIDGTAALLDALCVRQKHWADLGDRLINEE